MVNHERVSRFARRINLNTLFWDDQYKYIEWKEEKEKENIQAIADPGSVTVTTLTLQYDTCYLENQNYAFQV